MEDAPFSFAELTGRLVTNKGNVHMMVNVMEGHALVLAKCMNNAVRYIVTS